MLIIIALMMGVNTFSYCQRVTSGHMSSIVAGSDTLYLLDGRKISGNIMEYDQTKHVAYGIWNSTLKRLTNIQQIDKSKLHYIYADKKFHLINDVTEKDDIDRLRRNLLIYERRSRAGMVALTSGVGLVLTSMIYSEIRLNRHNEPDASKNPEDLNDIPKYLNYSGYGLMLVGGIIKISSYEFLERGSIDITPVGVRVNF
jgi:hypothetical protein